MLAELNRATVLHKRGNHKLALEILESSFSERNLDALSIEKQLLALDLLAALCEKQSLLSNARRYARDMVKRNKNDIRGYLRLGRVLQLSNDYIGHAVKVYELALQKVKPLKPAHEDFLKRQLSICKGKLPQMSLSAHGSRYRGPLELSFGPHHSSTLNDFTAILPVELCRIIFAKLNMLDRIKCATVCKRWQEYLYSEPTYWTNIDFSVVRPSRKRKYCVVNSETVIKYLNRSSSAQHCPLHLNLTGAYLKNGKTLFQRIPQSLASRLVSLYVGSDNTQGLSTRQLRETGNSYTRLQVLSMCSDAPMSDIKWCLETLPSLKSLDITISASGLDTGSPLGLKDLPKTRADLTHLRIQGATNQQSIAYSFLYDLVSLPSLTHIDLYRVAELWWPCLGPALENPRLKRLGFSSESVYANRVLLPMPRFNGQIEELQLNDTCLGLSVPLINIDGENWADRFVPGFTSMRTLRYLELVRTPLHDITLPNLLHMWGCTSTLETLVVHSMAEPPSETYEDNVFSALHTLEYTGMRALSDSRLNWLIRAFPNVIKVNLDATVLTGPQLVRIINGFKELKGLRCNNVQGISSDTVAWVKSLTNITVIF